MLLAGSAAIARPAAAVGLEGDAAAQHRFAGGLGLGWDQVGGVGRDGYPFLELYGQADWRTTAGFTMGAGLSARRDLADYHFALARWRGGKTGGSTGLGVHLALGYDGDRFHLSAGPWLVGDSRDADRFRGGLVPLGIVRLRIGAQDRWHVALQLIDGVPSTAGGGAISIRSELGLPVRDGHHRRFGLYGSVAEATAGVSASDEWPAALPVAVAGWLGGGGPAPRAPAVRVACLLGSDLFHLRPELTCATGLVF